MSLDHATHNGTSSTSNMTWSRPAGILAVLQATNDEVTQHEKILATLDKVSGGKTVWRTIN
jgi:hypothetical protein